MPILVRVLHCPCVGLMYLVHMCVRFMLFCHHQASLSSLYPVQNYISEFPKQRESNEFPREICKSSYTLENNFTGWNEAWWWGEIRELLGSFSNDDGVEKHHLKINTCATVTILRLSDLVRILQWKNPATGLVWALSKWIQRTKDLRLCAQVQPRSKGLSSLPPLVVGTDTLVVAGHVTTQNLGGRKICWKGGATGWYFIVLSTKCTWVPTNPAVLDG